MTSSSLRILHTEWSDGWGGQERRIIAEMTGMKARGHDMILATRPQCRIREEAQRQGIRVLEVDMRGKFDWQAILKLARHLKKEAVQVVDTHSGIDSWIGALAAKLAHTPVLVRTRHLNNPLRRSWLNFVHYLPDRIVTCGENTRAQLVGQCGFPAEQIASIPTGIDFSNFSPSLSRPSVRQALGIGDNDFLVLMVGILRSVKRHEIAMQAFQRFLERQPNAWLVLAGEGPMREGLGKLAAQLGIADRIKFLGHREDIPDLLAAADILLLTSRSEGVPQAVTQALGLGVPVIATAVGGVPELIIHEKTGLLVPPENPKAAAEALSRLANDPAFAARLGEAGRRHALDHFSLDTMLDKTESLFHTLLAEKTA
ncbi:MAG: glycosyltransferase [Sulfuricellaceae bacterium]|jgi:glycosyltransferase involved in cell wall biosynthesis